jgi:hypothetical protein
MEKPIIFSGEMVRAVLDGRKTQTRRVIKVPKPYDYGDDGIDVLWVTGEIKCPYQKGDKLWVRETFGYVSDHRVVYRADYDNLDELFKDVTWKPSIHMPRWASRITLLVKDVRVEQIQDISGDDCFAEGIDEESEVYNISQNILDNWGAFPEGSSHDIPDSLPEKAAFRELWDSINTKRGYGWDVNPWVWVVEFERCE